MRSGCFTDSFWASGQQCATDVLGRTIVPPGRANHSGAKAGTNASSGWQYKAFLSPLYWLAPGLLIVCGIALVVPNLLARVLSGAAFEHWSRFIAMSFFWLVAVILISARVVAYYLDLIAEQLAYLQSEPKIEKAGLGEDAYARS